MAITEFLEKNRKLYGDEVALVEVNPEQEETRKVTWKDYDLIQSTEKTFYRREITWRVLTKRPTAWPTCFWRGESSAATRLPF